MTFAFFSHIFWSKIEVYSAIDEKKKGNENVRN
jgi:hypothetical protein